MKIYTLSHTKKLAYVFVLVAMSAAVAWAVHAFVTAPSIGTMSDQITDRVSEFVAENQENGAVTTTRSLQYDPQTDQNKQLQTVRTDCFSITIPRLIQYLKTNSDTQVSTGEPQRQKCSVSGQYSQPRAQIHVMAEYRPDLLSLSELPGVQLRQKDAATYTPVTVEVLADSEYASFQTSSELVTLWYDSPMLYTVSLHSMARVTEDAQQAAAELITALEYPEVDGLR